MPEKKNFLIFAIGIGIVGVVIGAITIWKMILDILK